jgi:hypothetical protein
LPGAYRGQRRRLRAVCWHRSLSASRRCGQLALTAAVVFLDKPPSKPPERTRRRIS